MVASDSTSTPRVRAPGVLNMSWVLACRWTTRRDEAQAVLVDDALPVGRQPANIAHSMKSLGNSGLRSARNSFHALPDSSHDARRPRCAPSVADPSWT